MFLTPILTLRDAAGDVLATDDDSAGNLNAQISNFTLLANGIYTIEVGGVGGVATGDFTLTLHAGEIAVPTQTPIPQTEVPPPTSTPEVPPSPPGAIAYGESVSSVLVSGPNAHTFEGQAGDVVTITLDSNDFDAYLRLLDSSGNELTTDDDSAGDLNAQIQNFVLPSDGTYTILASGFDDTASGNYSLTLTLGGGGVVATPTIQSTLAPSGSQIVIGDTVAGTLTGDLVTTYTFQGEAGQVVDITLTSEAFDAYLSLIGPDGRELIIDDDSAGNLNARISLFELPANGTYTISVESYDGATGDYVLTLMAASINLIEYSQQVTGSLESGSATAGYRFTGAAGDVVTISLHSSDFDTYLSLREANGDGYSLVDDDDSGNGSDSLIGPFTLPDTGDYIITVRSYDGATAGSYTLQLNQAVLTPIEFNQPVTITFDGNTGAQYFSFQGTIGDVIDITVDSGDSIDTSLAVNGPDNYQLAYDDDSGPNFDPEVNHLILTQDGIYTILLQPFSNGDTGQVTLTLSRGAIPSLDDGPQQVRLSEKVTTDVVTFTGVAGETVRLTVTIVSGDNSAPSLVVTQDGTTIATASASTTTAMTFDFTVPADGVVTVQVSDYNYSKVVMEIALERLPE